MGQDSSGDVSRKGLLFARCLYLYSEKLNKNVEPGLAIPIRHFARFSHRNANGGRRQWRCLLFLQKQSGLRGLLYPQDPMVLLCLG